MAYTQMKIEISSTAAQSDRKPVSCAQPARGMAATRRARLPVESYLAVAAAIVILLIVLTTVPGLRW
jgi:hypothetical protein